MPKFESVEPSTVRIGRGAPDLSAYITALAEGRAGIITLGLDENPITVRRHLRQAAALAHMRIRVSVRDGQIIWKAVGQ